jgi:hypothetical protein
MRLMTVPGPVGEEGLRKGSRRLRRVILAFILATVVGTGSIVVANTVFTHNFPGSKVSTSNSSVLTSGCASLTSSGFPSTAPASGAILFDCSGHAAFKVNKAGSGTPTIHPSTVAGGPPSPYVTLSLNLHADPPLLPCVPSNKVVTSGVAVSFSADDAGHSFDYCASFTTTNTDFPSFTVTWDS